MPQANDTALTDAELLDSVRRLRSYMITMDNVHHVLNQVESIDDPTVSKLASATILDVPTINTKVSLMLRTIEASKQYRDMLKKYNMKEEDED